MEVEMKIRGLMMDPVTNMPIVVLKDQGSDTVLPIWVGVYEANAIALEIEKVTTPRPMTHDLLKNLLVGLETMVRKVVVTELRDDTFFAVIWLEREGQIDQHRLAAVGRAGSRAAHGLPHLCRGRSAEEQQAGQFHERTSVGRRVAQMAGEPGRGRSGALQDVRKPLFALPLLALRFSQRTAALQSAVHGAIGVLRLRRAKDARLRSG